MLHTFEDENIIKSLEIIEYKFYGNNNFAKKKYLVNSTKWFDTIEDIISFITEYMKHKN